jgi:hypothetical protein
MATPTQVFKGNPAVLRVNGIKIANVTSTDVDYNTNKANVPMSGGLGISKGFPIGMVNISTFETTGGLSSQDIISAIANQDVVEVEFTQGGVTFIVTGTGEKMSKKSQTDKGMTDGTYAFSGAVQTF